MIYWMMQIRDIFYDMDTDWVIDSEDSKLEFNFDEKKIGIDIKQMLDKASKVVYYR